MKIVDYGLCTGSNKFELISQVGDGLKKGYQPFGAPSLSSSSWIQVMVKYETEKESFDKSIAEEIKNLSEDFNEKLFSELLKISIKENEQLKYKLDGDSALIESLQKEITLLKEKPNTHTIELLLHALKYFILKNARYSLRHGYEITICGDDYCDDDHEKFHENILNNYLEKNKE